MIEKIVLDFLNRKLGNIVYTEAPDKKITEYILIEKTGGSEEDFIKSSTFAIQSFSESLYKTAALNERVKAVMDGIIELDEICSCSLNSDYNYTQSEKHKYRYQAVYDITHY